MAYHLQPQESVSAGIKRITYEQIDKAIDRLTTESDHDRGEAIHDARKSFKQLRAVVRLVRDEIGKSAYHRENACFRDAGRLLSEARDAQVRIETLDALTQHFADSVTPEAFSNIRRVLQEYRDSADETLMNDDDAICSAVDLIKTARDRVADWKIKSNQWPALEGGLKRVYKRGYLAYQTVQDQPTVENLHEWRKRVKYLWYHLKIICPIWPDMLGELSDQLHHLANYLGDDHDLAILRQFITAHSEQLKDFEDEVSVLVALIDRRRVQLQSDANLLGQRVYAEKASSFVKRLQAYWQAWRLELKQSVPVEV